MKKHSRWAFSSLGWAVSILALAFAALAIAFLMNENNVLTEQNEAYDELFEEDESASVSFTGKSNEVSDSSCTGPDECLFLLGDDYYPTGIATIEGYYDGVEARLDWNGDEVSCQRFTVTDGPELLLQGWKELAISGSGVVAQDMDGNFLLNINLDETDVTLVEDVETSLNVLVNRPGDYGVPACYSPFTILSVE